MKVTIRRAQEKELAAVERIYDAIHTEEEAGRACIGWEREIYPTRRTAEDALVRDDLFVEEAEGRIVGTAIINRVQVDAYAEVKWLYPALDEQVMVLHTLVIDPDEKEKDTDGNLWRFTRSMRPGAAVPACAWTPTPEMREPGGCIGTWDTERRGSCPACSTDLLELNW